MAAPNTSYEPWKIRIIYWSSCCLNNLKMVERKKSKLFIETSILLPTFQPLELWRQGGSTTPPPPPPAMTLAPLINCRAMDGVQWSAWRFVSYTAVPKAGWALQLSWALWRTETSLAATGNWSPERPAHSLFTTLTELLRLPILLYNTQNWIH
jgi:hypothetical protein